MAWLEIAPFLGLPDYPAWPRWCNEFPSRPSPLNTCEPPDHCVQVNGVELRELRISAIKSVASSVEMVQVIYKGPFAEIELDDGVVMRRGELLELPQSVAHRLTTGPAASAFGVLRPGNSGEA
jgi:hypothetical protein